MRRAACEGGRREPGIAFCVLGSPKGVGGWERLDNRAHGRGSRGKPFQVSALGFRVQGFGFATRSVEKAPRGARHARDDADSLQDFGRRVQGSGFGVKVGRRGRRSMTRTTSTAWCCPSCPGRVLAGFGSFFSCFRVGFAGFSQSVCSCFGVSGARKRPRVPPSMGTPWRAGTNTPHQACTNTPHQATPTPHTRIPQQTASSLACREGGRRDPSVQCGVSGKGKEWARWCLC